MVPPRSPSVRRPSVDHSSLYDWLERAVTIRIPDEVVADAPLLSPPDADADEPATSGGADDGSEPDAVIDASERAQRLLMLCGQDGARIDEVLQSAADCYSARMMEHASCGGDSTTFIALPRAASEALAEYMARPAVARQLEVGPHGTERALILSLIASLEPADASGEAPSTADADPAAARSDGPTPSTAPPAVLIDLREETDNRSSTDGDAVSDDAEEDDEEWENADGAGAVGHVHAAGLPWTPPGSPVKLTVHRPPTWQARPVRAHRDTPPPVQQPQPTPPSELLAPHEMGWPTMEDTTARGAAVEAAASVGLPPAPPRASLRASLAAGAADVVAAESNRLRQLQLSDEDAPTAAGSRPASSLQLPDDDDDDDDDDRRSEPASSARSASDGVEELPWMMG